VPRIYEPYIPVNENYGIVKFTPSINALSINFRSGSFQYTCTEEVNSSPMSRRPSFDGIRDAVRDLLGMRIDKLARQFAKTHVDSGFILALGRIRREQHRPSYRSSDMKQRRLFIGVRASGFQKHEQQHQNAEDHNGCAGTARS